jgi:hypothetical protein
MEQNTEQFLEALEVSNKIEEAGGLGQALKTVGRTIANAFGTAAGNAKRNAAAAKDAQQTAQTNAQTAQTNAQTNAMDDITLAKTINDAVTKAIGICDKGLQALQKQQPQQNEQPQNNQAPENSEKGGARQLNDQEEQERMGESLNFVAALNEAANNNNKTFYNKAKKALAGVQQLVRPFLTGQKQFTDKDIEAVSNAINDQSVQQVLGKNDKKSLKVIQNLNAALNAKKQAIQQNAQPEQQATQPQQNTEQPAQNGGTNTNNADNAANPAEQNTAQAANQGTQQQPAQGQGQAIDANAQKEINNVVNNTSDAQTKFENSLKALEKFKGNKVIGQLLQDWADFKKSLDDSRNAAAQK